MFERQWILAHAHQSNPTPLTNIFEYFVREKRADRLLFVFQKCALNFDIVLVVVSVSVSGLNVGSRSSIYEKKMWCKKRVHYVHTTRICFCCEFLVCFLHHKWFFLVSLPHCSSLSPTIRIQLCSVVRILKYTHYPHTLISYTTHRHISNAILFTLNTYTVTVIDCVRL